MLTTCVVDFLENNYYCTRLPTADTISSHIESKRIDDSERELSVLRTKRGEPIILVRILEPGAGFLKFVQVKRLLIHTMFSACNFVASLNNEATKINNDILFRGNFPHT